ncbi:MAG: hypothetical protein ABIY70_13600 [Capsulimonas sp.]|uniref:hypothetical protein n=1 Tax=Capsulimonas sp. TaxID=2494211 RepID=UPI003265DA05
MYTDTQRSRPPEALIAIGTLICLFAIIYLSYAPGLWFLSGLSWRRAADRGILEFFAGIGVVHALSMTLWLWLYRKRASVRYGLGQELEKRRAISNTAMFTFTGCASCTLLVCFTSNGLRQNWPHLLLCEGSAWGVSRLLGWILSSPPPSSADTSGRPTWLPRTVEASITSTEIRFRGNAIARVVLGLFVIFGMGGMTVACAWLTFAPGIWFGGPMGLFFRVFCGFLLIGSSFFTFILLGVLAPQNLILNLNTRTYVQDGWKPLPGSYGQQGIVFPFSPIHWAGSFDEDIAGFRLKEYLFQGDTKYSLQLVWKEGTRTPYTLRAFETDELGEQAMLEAARALGVTPLGTWA